MSLIQPPNRRLLSFIHNLASPRRNEAVGISGRPNCATPIHGQKRPDFDPMSRNRYSATPLPPRFAEPGCGPTGPAQPLHTWYVGVRRIDGDGFEAQQSPTTSPHVFGLSARLRAFSSGYRVASMTNRQLRPPKCAKSAAPGTAPPALRPHTCGVTGSPPHPRAPGLAGRFPCQL